MKKINLVTPAGSIEKLKIAIEMGTDIVCVGGKILNMRFGSNNFEDNDLIEAIKYVHKFEKKIYVTLNAVPHNNEIELLPDYLIFLEKIGIDGVIVTDLGVFQCVREFSELPITIETHSSNTNWHSVKMWQTLGAHTVVLHRDVTLENIYEIRQKVPHLKLEISIHGPLNMAISGRPLISNYIEAKNLDKNPYQDDFTITEETRPGENMPIFQDNYGTAIFSGQDICGIDVVFALLEIGIDNIKIQGGMKDLNYLQTVTKVYREALDSFLSGEPINDPTWIERLKKTTDTSFIDLFIKP